jgi:outer membrane protein OmpA-like peptidoglycan-associated protein
MQVLGDDLKAKPRLNKKWGGIDVNIGGYWGEIYDKKLPDRDYSEFKPVRDYSTEYGLKHQTHFCLDSAILTAAARQALRIVCAKYLTLFTSDESKLVIKGYADTLGTNPHNDKLSNFRAFNTLSAIKDILGVKFPNNMEAVAVGLGEIPAHLAGNLDQTPDPKWRRVDVFLNGHVVISLQTR